MSCVLHCSSPITLLISGVPRKPGMTRDDLFNINAGIVKNLVTAAAKHCPEVGGWGVWLPLPTSPPRKRLPGQQQPACRSQQAGRALPTSPSPGSPPCEHCKMLSPTCHDCAAPTCSCSLLFVAACCCLLLFAAACCCSCCRQSLRSSQTPSTPLSPSPVKCSRQQVQLRAVASGYWDCLTGASHAQRFTSPSTTPKQLVQPFQQVIYGQVARCCCCYGQFKEEGCG